MRLQDLHLGNASEVQAVSFSLFASSQIIFWGFFGSFVVGIRVCVCADTQHFLLQGLGKKHFGDCFSLLQLGGLVFFFPFFLLSVETSFSKLGENSCFFHPTFPVQGDT